jgi:glycosyltransferase involved in cell wall biosynthesis
MRLLVANHGVGLRGGAERCVLELASALQADGRVTPIVTVPFEEELSTALEAAGIDFRVMPTPTWLVDESPPLPSDPLRAARRVKRAVRATKASAWVALLRELRPDVVMSSTTFSPTAALASWRVGVPHVWWVHEFMTLDHRRNYVIGERLSQRAIGRLSVRVVANSGAVARHYSPPIPESKIRVCRCGVEQATDSPNVLAPGELRLLLLGRKAPGKGCDRAIRAIAEHRVEDVTLRLRLVGPTLPGYEEQLRRLADDLGVADRVEFVEYASDPTEHFRWCNVLLMCSEAEAFGRVTVEALKSGRPVIGCRSGGTSELIDEGKTGFLYEPDDPRGLVDAIHKYAADSALVREMSAAAAVENEHRFTMRDEVEFFVDLLTSAARQREDA